MIQPLLSEVERLRGVLAQHKDYLSKTESATRYAVIDPVLALLGWDVHDAGSVLAEYRVGAAGTNFVDYALLRDGRPVALIEAKALAVPLADKELEQLSNYCYNCRPQPVRWGILTNGDRWLLVDALDASRSLPDRVVLDRSLSGGHSLDALSGLVLLFGSITGHDHEPHGSKALTSDAQPLSAIESLAKPYAKLAIELQFPGKPAIAVRTWSGLVYQTLAWLADSGRLTASACPLKDTGGKWSLADLEPRHTNGQPFAGPRQLPGGLHITANYDCAGCVRNALHALATLGVDPDSVRWRPL